MGTPDNNWPSRLDDRIVQTPEGGNSETGCEGCVSAIDGEPCMDDGSNCRDCTRCAPAKDRYQRRGSHDPR